MADVILTIYSSFSMQYRQSTTAGWLPVNGDRSGMSVSTATQFMVGGIIYKYTKGSWTSGTCYRTLSIANGILKFQDENRATEFVQYNA